MSLKTSGVYWRVKRNQDSPLEKHAHRLASSPFWCRGSRLKTAWCSNWPARTAPVRSASLHWASAPALCPVSALCKGEDHHCVTWQSGASFKVWPQPLVPCLCPHMSQRPQLCSCTSGKSETSSEIQLQALGP